MILEFCENCKFIRTQNKFFQTCHICGYNKFKKINIEELEKE